jgi:hypothetical protein
MPKYCCYMVSLIGLCCLTPSTQSAEPVAHSRWLSDWEEARKVARAADKPLFVVFRCQH